MFQDTPKGQTHHDHEAEKLARMKPSEKIIEAVHRDYPELFDNNMKPSERVWADEQQARSIAIGGDEKIVWRSKYHSDGELAFGGDWFVLGIGVTKEKQMTYHLPMSYWEETDFAETLDLAPEWDGHTSADVLERLKLL